MSKTKEQKLWEPTESWPQVAKRLRVKVGTLAYAYVESGYEAGIIRGAEEEREALLQIVADESYGHDLAQVTDRIAEAIRARGKG